MRLRSLLYRGMINVIKKDAFHAQRSTLNFMKIKNSFNPTIFFLLASSAFIMSFFMCGCSDSPGFRHDKEQHRITHIKTANTNVLFLTKLPPDSKNWPVFLSSSMHTGKSDSPPIESKIIAKIPTGGRIMGSPVIYKKRAYIGSMNGYLYCIEISGNPGILWRFKAGNKLTSTPGVDNEGNIYIGSQDKYFYAIDPEGSLKWKYKTGGPISSAVNFDIQGNLIIGSLDGYIYCISDKGKLQWKFRTGHTELEFTSTPAIDMEGNIYTGSDDGNIYALDKNGKLKWKLMLGKPVVSSPSIDKYGNIYVGCNDSNIYSISRNGEIRWKYKTGGVVESSPVIENKTENVFAGCADKNIYAIDFRGNKKWKYKTGGAVNSSGAIDRENNVYFGSEDGCVYSLSSSGKLRWKTKCGGVIIASPAIAVGVLVVGSEDGNIYVLGLNSPQRHGEHEDF